MWATNRQNGHLVSQGTALSGDDMQPVAQRNRLLLPLASAFAPPVWNAMLLTKSLTFTLTLTLNVDLVVLVTSWTLRRRCTNVVARPVQ